MSGIAGIYYLDNRIVDLTEMGALADRLAYRGPDQVGVWHKGPVGFCHCMLWTTPESLHEKLPLEIPQVGLAITADARIDNREELFSILKFNGRPQSELSDSELILKSYEKWGEECVTHLVGDFAFAIWDEGKQSLFCARDPMGIKPLFFFKSGKLLIFASDIASLFCHPEVPKTINELRVAFHLAFIEEEDRRVTFFQDIQQLPAAHQLTIQGQSTQIRRYWSLDPEYELHMRSDEDYVEAFRSVFSEAVRRRLRSAFPIGSLLSGGLDSSSIVVTARKLLRDAGNHHSLHTFSDIFPRLAQEYPKIDERPWMEAVLSQGGLQAHYIHADELSPLEPLAFTEDEPYGMPNLWLDWGCFKAARQDGLRVILTGYDGDTALSYGHGFFAELARDFHLISLFKEANALAMRTGRPLRNVLWHYGLSLLYPDRLARLEQKIKKQKPNITWFDPIIDPRFGERVGLEQQIQVKLEAEELPIRTARDMHSLGIVGGLTLYGIEIIHKMGAYFSMEARFPFFDRHFIEFVVSLPTRFKLHQGWNRFILRSSMEGWLPPEVQWRTSKGDLNPNVRRGLVEDDHEILDELIVQDTSLIEPYVDIPALQSIYRQFVANPMKSSSQDLFSILAAVSLGLWLRKLHS